MLPTAFSVGLFTTSPPIGALYHTTLCPAVAVIASLAFKVWIGLSSHSVIPPVLVGISAAGLIVKATGVLVKPGQVPEFGIASA